jgi:hypothetical protein
VSSISTPDLPWRVEDIDFTRLSSDRVRDDDTLFFLLVSASFVEIESDLYTRNLSAYYSGDEDLLHWLADRWEHEEVQHGRALRRYVQQAWPEFDWEAAHRGFAAEYRTRCTMAEFEPSRALELAARCVVETGTASYYRTLHDYTTEPVLKQLTGHIKGDEVRHYARFLRGFERYQAREPSSRWSVLRALLRRVTEAHDDDGEIAFRHAWNVRYPERAFQPCHYAAFTAQVKQVMRRHFPTAMAVRMLLKPLRLPAAVQRPLVPLLARTAGLVFM